MCLASVENVRELPEFKDKEVIAYKIFKAYKKFDGTLNIMTPYRDFFCAPDTWLTANEHELIARKSGWHDGEVMDHYISGFHAFETREQAEKALDGCNGKILEVKLRNVHTRGLDGTSPWTAEEGIINIVASEMFIPSSQLETL